MSLILKSSSESSRRGRTRRRRHLQLMPRALGVILLASVGARSASSFVVANRPSLLRTRSFVGRLAFGEERSARPIERGLHRSTVVARGGRNKGNMPRGVKKENLPEKICVTCNRPFTWRKKYGNSQRFPTAGPPDRPTARPLERPKVRPLEPPSNLPARPPTHPQSRLAIRQVGALLGRGHDVQRQVQQRAEEAGEAGAAGHRERRGRSGRGGRGRHGRRCGKSQTERQT